MRIRRTISAIAPGLIVLACGVAELFQSDQIGAVTLVYTGPTEVSVGDTVPITVTVTAGDTPLTAAHVSVTSSDTTVLALSAGGDTLFARDRGNEWLTFRVIASIFTDSFPTFEQLIRVRP